VTQRIEDLAGEQGRSVDRWLHRMYAWCGVGDSRGTARPGIKDAMEQLYRIPFERFERYCPMGSPRTSPRLCSPSSKQVAGRST
jgi:hypothetical protein